ncbi:hypothetical protein [Riemerella anatipestifer]|uniref:hypothetical protein n=1 Tax=Riemerella anatipestifer TaxID=34085 RepID=UPI00129DE5DD|nr:hypothetical protein [Riemerella anatipestifer]MRM83347.1 hypothetical protein [Riemerella anatipestifer]
MKKSIFSIGLLTLGVISIKSQTLAYVGKTAEVYVKPGTLVYSGGTVEVKDTGVIENQGNIMIDNGGFSTENSSGSGVKLKLDSSSSYGQLWINNTDQSQITGSLTKECMATNEGAYQHIALPFNNKEFSTLSAELGKTFTEARGSLDEILVSRNSMVRADVVKLAQKTNDVASLSGNHKTAYYSLGNKGNSVDYTQKKGIMGVPFSSGGVNVTLSGAGATVDFGANGSRRNYWGGKI